MTQFNRVKDWQVEFIEQGHYAIFHKIVNLEWVDEASGENLCFETAKEARKYLNEVFKENKNA